MDLAPASSVSRSSSSAGLRLAGSALILLAVAGAVLDWLLAVAPASPASLIAVAGLIAMGIVMVGVSLVAHIFETRDLADIGALLDRAEQRNRIALMLADEVTAELERDSPSDRTGRSVD